MSCGASIATRAGLHLRCLLEDGHEGGCLPELPVPRVRAAPAPYWIVAPEVEFVQHLLAIVESAGDTLTFAEALNIARSLCRSRLCVPEPRP